MPDRKNLPRGPLDLLILHAITRAGRRQMVAGQASRNAIALAVTRVPESAG